MTIPPPDKIRHFSIEALISIVVAFVVSVGAFYSLRTSLEYDEKEIQRLVERVDALEGRERQDRDILIRLEQHIEVLDSKMDRVLDRFNGK